MGIQGLWGLLEPSAEPVALENLEGKRLAIDVSLWIHQAICGSNRNTLDSRNPHLSLLINRLAKLLFYKIKPLFVFDGSNVPQFKKALLRERQVKSYIEEMSLSKAQKRLLAEAAQKRGLDIESVEQVVEQKKKKRKLEDDFSSIYSQSAESSKDDIEILSSSKIWMTGDRKEQSLSSYDQKLDLLLNVKRETCGGLSFSQIPEDSEMFSSFQISRLRKRNCINNEIDRLKREALGKELASDNKLGSVKLKMSAMEGAIRGHFITVPEKDDTETAEEIFDPSNVSSENSRNSLWSERSNSPFEMAPLQKSFRSNSFDENDEDADLREAIRLSLLEKNKQVAMEPVELKSSRKEFESLSKSIESEVLVVRNDFQSENSLSSDDEFIDVPDEIEEFIDTPEETKEKMFSEEVELPSTSKITEMCEEPSLTSQDWIPSYVSSSSKPRVPEELTCSPSIDLQRGVITECQELLKICGIPFIVAPSEAEAQCCKLESLGLVQGIVSDDSDVWLFGAATVYKNMFNQKRQLQMFTRKHIHDQLGLDRWDMIAIGLLSGGDYTTGLKSVGVVSALELLAEFSGKKDQKSNEKEEDQAFGVLQKISNWLNFDDHVTSMFVPHMKAPFDKHVLIEDTIHSTRDENCRTRKLKKLIEENNNEDRIKSFLSRDVFDAYATPVVNSSNSKFTWRPVKLEEFKKFVWNKLGWDSDRIKGKVEKSLLRWNEFLNPRIGGGGVAYQTHITSFARKLQKCEQDQRLLLTSRVKTALMRLSLAKGISPSNVPFPKFKFNEQVVCGSVNVNLEKHPTDDDPKKVKNSISGKEASSSSSTKKLHPKLDIKNEKKRRKKKS